MRGTRLMRMFAPLAAAVNTTVAPATTERPVGCARKTGLLEVELTTSVAAELTTVPKLLVTSTT